MLQSKASMSSKETEPGVAKRVHDGETCISLLATAWRMVQFAMFQLFEGGSILPVLLNKEESLVVSSVIKLISTPMMSRFTVGWQQNKIVLATKRHADHRPSDSLLLNSHSRRYRRRSGKHHAGSIVLMMFAFCERMLTGLQGCDASTIRNPLAPAQTTLCGLTLPCLCNLILEKDAGPIS